MAQLINEDSGNNCGKSFAILYIELKPAVHVIMRCSKRITLGSLETVDGDLQYNYSDV